MHFLITEDSVELVDPQDVKRFSAVCRDDLSEAAFAASVRDNGLGEPLPGGEHVMVSIDAVRALAADRVGPGWDDDFAGMVAYARSKGWLDEAGAHIRAHVERTPA